MFQWLADKLSEYIPAYLLVLIFIVITVIYALYLFARAVIWIWDFYKATKNTNDSLKEFNQKIEESFEKFKKEIRKDMKQLKDAWTNFETNLRVITGPKNKRLATASSPIDLTPIGEKLIEESGAKKIVDDEENVKKILSIILSEPRPTNAYDAQQKTIEIFRGLKDDAIFSLLKDYAFKHGIVLEDILFAIAIYFRKKVLKELGLKEEDIDKK